MKNNLNSVFCQQFQYILMQEEMQPEIMEPIYAGEIHYSRVPVQYWQHRIQMIKAMGLNALSVYIMWNYHQVSKGCFDYHSDNKNLPLFLELAEKYDMKVLIRPGPYVCAEWDFGGLPARLLGIPDLKIRANNQKFLHETQIYFQSLVPIFKRHLRTQNYKGCIIMLQIQNQYGFFGKDKAYIEAIRNIWRDLQINCVEYYVDWARNIGKSFWKGANIGVNDFTSTGDYHKAKSQGKCGLIFGGQVYSGWMTHWTEQWVGKPVQKVRKNFHFLMKNGFSFAMYMVHGGTNFGLTAGANGLNHSVNDYWGAVTSYDYDAPINEQGSPTEKYYTMRSEIMKFAKWPIPEIPEQIPMIEIPQIAVTSKGSLFSNLPKEFIQSDTPLPFQSFQLQMFHQGIVLYSTELKKQSAFYIKLVVHDYALVYLGSKLCAVLNRTQRTYHGFTIVASDFQNFGTTLRILVQASGHINFDTNMETDLKGIYSIGGDFEQDQVWKMWKFPLDYSSISKWEPIQENDNVWGETYPKLYRGQFNLESVGDSYLDITKYGKGYLYVNGHNLGRYWNTGPQKRLFCPGCWLRKGANQILVLNVYGEGGLTIKGIKYLYDEPITKEKCSIM